ncbi:MAG TPA: redoxin domain-containing protein [Myxococcales bacterium]
MPGFTSLVLIRGAFSVDRSDVHRAVIRAYGVHDEERNVAYRSTFIVDREGVLRWGHAGDRDMFVTATRSSCARLGRLSKLCDQ